MTNLPRTAVALFILACLAAAPLLAQKATAVVDGTVVDSTGAAIPDAKVTAISQETNIATTKNSSADGSFTLLDLLPGAYTLTAEKPGFKKLALPVFNLDVNQTLTQKLVLQVGDTSETVTVSAESVGVMLQRASTELGTIIDAQAVEGLPLNGRNFTELLILQPGVNPMNTAQGANGIGSADGGNIGIPTATVYRPSTNGASNRSNSFYLDGIINTDNRGGGWAIQPIADSIAEFKVQSHNNDTQYGNVLGSVVNVVTKSGTNHFHGSLWDFDRNSIFDARNPFTGFCTTANCPAVAAKLASDVSAGQYTTAGAAAVLSGTPTSPLGYTYNIYGGTFGGPIKKNKTFFFFGYEGWHYAQPQNTLAVVPSPQELAGDFSGTVSPELIGTVNAAKNGITPAVLYNPFAESGNSSAVQFTCDSQGNPTSLLNPGAAFGATGYGIQSPGGTPCNKIPSGLIDQKLANVISQYTAAAYKNCAFTPNYATAVDNCLDSRSKTDVANNYNIRIDHRFSDKNTVFARASMLWDTDAGIVAGTSSIAPSPYHELNIGGAWDHIFTPTLILEVRGGINSRPVVVNQTNPLGLTAESGAGFTNLTPTSGFYLDPAGYPSIIGNVGPEHRANPEHGINGAVTWLHGKHNIRFGGEYVYENRLETNQYEEYISSTSQTCPTNSSGTFACSGNEGNALASILLDLPSSLKVNVPQYEEIHVAMQPFGFFLQDEWHVNSKLTVNLGLRYDYVPAVKLSVSDGETINALDLPDKQFIIGSAETSAYSTGCNSTPQMPPCVPGGLNNNPAFTVTTGGVTYNTLNNIVFSPNSQPALKRIGDNIGPRIGIAYQIVKNTVLRMGYGMFYDTISYVSQNAENTLQGSIWPWTAGVSDTLNNSPMGATPTTTTTPICNSLAACGPYGGYSTSQLTGLVGGNPVIVAPTPWGSTFGGYSDAPNWTDPRSQQWNIQIERQVGASSMVSVAYVGSHTQRLEFCCAANYPQGGPYCEPNAAQGFTCPTTPLTTSQISQQEYMPFASNGWHYSESVGFNTFNSLQSQFQHRFSHGLQTLAAFTWEKCLGDSNGGYGAENGDVGNIQYYFNKKIDKGFCAMNVPLLFNWSTVYQTPFGPGRKWLTHGVVSKVLGGWDTNYSFIMRSGQAFNPTWGGASSICTLTTTTNCVPATIGGVASSSNDPANLSNTSGSATGYARPDMLPGCQIKPAVQTVAEYYNPACFVSPSSLSVGPGYGFGTFEAGSLRTMRWVNVDVALVKNIRMGEAKQLQIRGEAFNVFNHQVLGEPGQSIAPTFANGSVSYGSAMTITGTANTPRIMQLAVKFRF